MEWHQVIVALLTGGALTALINGGVSLIRRKMELKRPFEDTIRQIDSIYYELSELKRKIGADRVLIYATKNGGGIPRAGAHLYASVLFEVFDKNAISIRRYWQDRAVDKSHINLLSKLEESSVVTLSVNDMEDGDIKNSYLSTNMQYVALAKIKSTPEKYFYISCDFIDKVNASDAQSHILDIASKIRNIL